MNNTSKVCIVTAGVTAAFVAGVVMFAPAPVEASAVSSIRSSVISDAGANVTTAGSQVAPLVTDKPIIFFDTFDEKHFYGPTDQPTPPALQGSDPVIVVEDPFGTIGNPFPASATLIFDGTSVSISGATWDGDTVTLDATIVSAGSSSVDVTLIDTGGNTYPLSGVQASHLSDGNTSVRFTFTAPTTAGDIIAVVNGIHIGVDI